MDQRFSGKSDASGKFDFSQLQFLPACLKSVARRTLCSTVPPQEKATAAAAARCSLRTSCDDRIRRNGMSAALAREVLRIKTYSIAWRVLKSSTTISAPKSGKKCATDQPIDRPVSRTNGRVPINRRTAQRCRTVAQPSLSALHDAVEQHAAARAWHCGDGSRSLSAHKVLSAVDERTNAN